MRAEEAPPPNPFADTPLATHRIWIVGEIHGSAEGAEVLQTLADGVPSSRSLAIGLEIPPCLVENNEVQLNAECDTSGASDGRLTRELLAALAHIGGARDIQLFGFDVGREDSSRGTPGGETQAAHVIRQAASRYDQVIILTGNLHGQRTPRGAIIPSGGVLGDDAVRINIANRTAGEVFACFQHCAVQEVGATPNAAAAGLNYPASGPRYDCDFAVESLRAAQPLRAP